MHIKFPSLFRIEYLSQNTCVESVTRSERGDEKVSKNTISRKITSTV